MHNFEACPLSVFGYSHHDALITGANVLDVRWIVHKKDDKVLLIWIIFLLQVEGGLSFNTFLVIPEMRRSLIACFLNVHGNNLVVSCVVDQKPRNNFVTFSNSTLGCFDKINAQDVCVREVPVYRAPARQIWPMSLTINFYQAQASLLRRTMVLHQKV